MTFTLATLSPVASLVLFAVWGLLLVISIGTWRLAMAVSGNVPQGGFNPGTPHGGAAYWRLNRAHMNVVENLPFFGAIVLGGMIANVQEPNFQMLASIVLFARIAQTIIHITSGAQVAILLRFTAYLVQVFSMLGMAAMVLQATGLTVPV
jgi:uncharacterized MAPEG superfamily protein